MENTDSNYKKAAPWNLDGVCKPLTRVMLWPRFGEAIGDGVKNSSKVWVGITAVLLLICIGGLLNWMRMSGRGAGNVPRDFVDDDRTGASTRDTANASAQTTDFPPGQLTVHMDKSGPQLGSTMYGLTLEEINHSLDGGLYAELLQNRDLSQHGMTIQREAARHILCPFR